MKKKKKQNLADLRTFFLACEFKPGTELWKTIEGFAYDIKPAFIYGSLGIISYEPDSYGILEVSQDLEPLMGYICTITEPITLQLLDKIKGYQGNFAFNFHKKTLVHAYTDVNVVQDAWAYIVSDSVLEAYRSIEKIDFGIWNEDQKQIELLEKIGEEL